MKAREITESSTVLQFNLKTALLKVSDNLMNKRKDGVNVPRRMTCPPFPPSPPSGPAHSFRGNDENVMHPSPPFPPFTRTFWKSTNRFF